MMNISQIFSLVSDQQHHSLFWRQLQQIVYIFKLPATWQFFTQHCPPITLILLKSLNHWRKFNGGFRHIHFDSCETSCTWINHLWAALFQVHYLDRLAMWVKIFVEETILLILEIFPREKVWIAVILEILIAKMCYSSILKNFASRN